MTPPPAPADTSPRRGRLKARATRLWEHLDRGHRGLPWSFIILGTLGAVIALWPLATTVWDLLGLTNVQGWRLITLSVCALLLAAGVGRIKRGRTSPVRLAWLILATWMVAVGAITVLTVLAWLMLGAPAWQPLENLTPKHLDAIATRAFAIIAGLGGVALLVIAYRRQRSVESDGQRAELTIAREETKLFTERFTTAVSQLGEEQPAVRLGGVHALAHLADDAPEGRDDLVQMVIDVLCAYLRMPYTPLPEPPGQLSPSVPSPTSPTTAVSLSRLRSFDHDDARHEKQQTAQEEYRKQLLEFESFQQVRHTIIRVIGNHLREPTRWRGKNYDFTGVVFDGADLSGAEFTGGDVSFNSAKFTSGQVKFVGADFTSGKVNFNNAEFTGGQVDFFLAKFTGGKVNFFLTKFTGGKVNFNNAKFTSGQVKFVGADFTSGQVSFNNAEFTGGLVDFFLAEFTGGLVDFFLAKFTGGKVNFNNAKFTGGKVNFAGVSGVRPVELLKAINDGEPGVVVLPDHWRPNPKKNGARSGAGNLD